MIVAIDSSGQRVEGKHAARGGDYFCPECTEAVVSKKGKIVVHHFAHKTEGCQYGRGETDLHRRAKTSIWNAIKSESSEEVLLPGQNGPVRTGLEIPLRVQPGGKCKRSRLRPDVLAKLPSMSRPAAIEVQASSLTLDDIVDRTIGYEELGVAVLWCIATGAIPRNDEIRRFPAWESWIHAYGFSSALYWLHGADLAAIHLSPTWNRHKQRVARGHWINIKDLVVMERRPLTGRFVLPGGKVLTLPHRWFERRDVIVAPEKTDSNAVSSGAYALPDTIDELVHDPLYEEQDLFVEDEVVHESWSESEDGIGGDQT